MAGVTGLEPAASCVTGRRSNRLSYTPATFIIAVKNFKTAYILYFKFIVFKYFLMSYILIFSKLAVYSRFSIPDLYSLCPDINIFRACCLFSIFDSQSCSLKVFTTENRPSPLTFTRLVLFLRSISRISIFDSLPFFPPQGGKNGGERWIRTIEGISQQIYSLPRLAALESPHSI